MVNESTYGLRGKFTSVILDNQVYRIKYSGPDSVLERFAITSIDPILGQWSVELISEGNLLPNIFAEENTVLKIKYKADTTLITVGWKDAKNEYKFI